MRAMSLVFFCTYFRFLLAHPFPSASTLPGKPHYFLTPCDPLCGYFSSVEPSIELVDVNAIISIWVYMANMTPYPRVWGRQSIDPLQL